MGRCNYCHLKAIERRAKETGAEVIIQSAYERDIPYPEGFQEMFPKAQMVYVVQPGETFQPESHPRVTMIEISEECVC